MISNNSTFKCVLVFAFFFSYSFTGCTKTQKIQYSTSEKEFYDIQYYTGFGSDDVKHRLNLFLPKNVDNPPIVLWIHGGAWAFGGRKFETELARKFAKVGIAVAVISYRLSPGTWKNPKWDTGIQHPEHIKDVARAFAWVHDHGDQYNYDKNSIFVSGYSAGGHLSALLALDPTYLTDVGKSVRDIKGTIPIAGAYDIESYYNSHLKYNGKALADGHVKAVFGETMKQLREASPTSYAENQWIPMLVMSETESYHYTRLFENAAISAGNENIEFYHVRDKDHTGLSKDLSINENSRYRKKIVDFINSNKSNYQYLDKKDFKLAYKLYGQGDPLFLLNGGPGYASHHFKDLAKKLGENNTVILFDQRGTGYSQMKSTSSSNITMELMVEDLEDLRNHLGYEQINLMGHSFGGIYAMSYAAVYPHRVKQMILSHSGGANMDFMSDIDSRLRSKLNQKELADLNSIPGSIDPNIRSIIRSKSIAPGYVYDRKYAAMVFKGLAFKSRFYPNINRLVFQDMWDTPYDLTDEMKQFDKPVLIIHGDTDIVNPDVAKYSQDLFDDSKLVMLENCAHYGWIEHPKIYFEQIQNFLSG